MPKAAFFRRLGLFVRDSFFDPEMCARLRREADSAPSAAGAVAGTGGEEVDLDVRKVRCARVSMATMDLLESHLLAIRDDLARHFQVPLSHCDDLDLLVYHPGDLYQPHRDGSVTGRKISVVVFLTSQAEETGTVLADGEFRGGDLTFYGILDPREELLGVNLQPVSGTLIAFRSDIVHEVREVKEGQRMTLAAWFL